MPLRGQKAITDAIGKNMEEENGFFNAFEVWGDLYPAAEVMPLAPGSCNLLEDGIGETLSDRCFCSILVRLCLHTDEMGSRRQCLLCGKCVRKWEINFRSGS